MEALTYTPILVDQVHTKLVNAIMDWTLLPGQRILQADLAVQLGVSRQPVSHALQLLKQQGLVQDAGRKGLEITPIDPVRIRQLYEVRASLDALAATLAARRVREKDVHANELEKMTAVLTEASDLDDASSIFDRVKLDVKFHLSIYDLANNPAIHEMIAPQWPHLRRSMYAVLEADKFRLGAWVEHRDIASRIFAGDAEGAGRAAHAHAINAGTDTERRLQGSSSKTNE